MVVRTFIAVLLMLLAVPAFSQFERAQVNITCPCTLTSADGESAELSFGLVNNTNLDVYELYATLGIAGTRISSSNQESDYSAFVDTVALNLEIDANSSLEPTTYELDITGIPEGSYYFELILHDQEVIGGHPILDSVWFKGEWSTPIDSLNLADANYLIDSDGDGVGDINEEFENTDPDDPNSFPSPPVIDILVLHEALAFAPYNMGHQTFIPHVLAATNDIFERSNSPAYFRTVGILDETDVPELSNGEPLEQTRYLTLLEEYDADLVLSFRSRDIGLCGFAVLIGGKGDKGFLHPNERLPYTEVNVFARHNRTRNRPPHGFGTFL